MSLFGKKTASAADELDEMKAKIRFLAAKSELAQRTNKVVTDDMVYEYLEFQDRRKENLIKEEERRVQREKDEIVSRAQLKVLKGRLIESGAIRVTVLGILQTPAQLVHGVCCPHCGAHLSEAERCISEITETIRSYHQQIALKRNAGALDYKMFAETPDPVVQGGFKGVIVSRCLCGNGSGDHSRTLCAVQYVIGSDIAGLEG